MLEVKNKGNDAFSKGKLNKKNNMQCYRDAINFYYEAIAWSCKVDMESRSLDDLNEMKSNLYSNISLCHLQLKNWGFSRYNSQESLKYNKNNVKAYYRLAKSNESLKNFLDAGDAIESGLRVEPENKELHKLNRILHAKIVEARKERRKCEQIRTSELYHAKRVWKYCNENKMLVKRVPFIEEDDSVSQQWGKLPSMDKNSWSWPTLFLYPTHNQSDFIENFDENDMIAIHLAQLFPSEKNETDVQWDYNNEFICSNLEVYFALHEKDDDSIQLLQTLPNFIKFVETYRAISGKEGPEVFEVAQCLEKKLLKKYSHSNNKSYNMVRVHPALTLRDLLLDSRMVVPNFVVTLLVFPMDHPMLHTFLNEHKCVDILQPQN